MALRTPDCRLRSVGHRILDIVYNVLKKGQDYRERGADYLDEPEDKERIKQRRLKRLEKLGVKVTVASESEVA